MTLTEFYNEIQSNYEEVLGRLLKEERIIKYLRKFSQDDEYAKLENFIEEQNWGEAFRSTHSLKGMCLNLGISKLGESSSALCEELRGGAPKIDITDMLAKVKEDYYFTIEQINKIDG